MSPRWLLLSVVVLVGAAEASAQSVLRPIRPVAREASNGSGRLLGTVLDEGGSGLGGVSIVAIGASLAAATTDVRGRFQLDLPAGAYVVRAERAGYISSDREIVDVRPYSSLERRIRLIRTEAQPQGVTPAAPPPVPDTGTNRSEIAWRLRHLSRTVLRDISPAALADAEQERPFGSASLDSLSLLDRTIQRSARLASSFLGDTAFTGQLNLFTVRSVAMPSSPAAMDRSRGIADVIIGAPVGTVGDWSVRGAILAGDSSSWTLFGEYQARDEQRHPLHVAISYSTQGYAGGRDLPMSMVAPESRSAGGIRVSDRWQVGPLITIDYGVQYDRYDYLSQPDLFSPAAEMRVKAFDRTHLIASSSQRMVAPGADEFLPPGAAGPWLPPTRTFASLSSSAPLRPERVRRHAIGFEHDFANRLPVVRVEWFSSDTVDQLATLYGLDQSSEVGHYYVTTAGNFRMVGWRVRAGGEFLENVYASIEYAGGDVWWSHTRGAGALRRTVPALSRRGADRVSDVRASVDVNVPRTATHVAIAYRLNTAERGAAAQGGDRIGDGRFNVEIAQRLPYQPLDSGLLNFLFTLRTFLHDDATGSLYDEVLTLRPPTRLTGGLQVRF